MDASFIIINRHAFMQVHHHKLIDSLIIETTVNGIGGAGIDLAAFSPKIDTNFDVRSGRNAMPQGILV